MIKEKFKEQVQKEIAEIFGNPAAELAFNENLTALQQKRKAAGFRECNQNFVEKNITDAKDVNQHMRFRQQFLRTVTEQRTEEAKIRRLEAEESRVDKIQFNS